jgi:peroxiredoxin
VFVLTAWAESVGAGDEIVMLGDGNAAILDGGVVRQLMVEPDPLLVTVSSADSVLDAL